LKRPWALPLVPFYAAGAALRRIGMTPKRLAWPVISVGSLSAGGAGKTPFVIALAQLLKREGFYVDVLSRGYGRLGTAVERVDPQGDAERFGDEPLLIAREAGVPVFVGAQRFKAGQLAEQATKAGVHLLDDGFQHRQLARDVDIVLVSSEDLGDSLLPAGNLREGLGALKRADVLAVPAGDDSAAARLWGMGLKQPIWEYRREMDVPTVSGSTVAFCGIARPEQFFSGLEQLGVSIAARKSFRDHARLGWRDLELLRKLAAEVGAETMLTTEKDRIRLGDLKRKWKKMPQLVAVGLRVVLGDETEILRSLAERLKIRPL